MLLAAAAAVALVVGAGIVIGPLRDGGPAGAPVAASIVLDGSPREVLGFASTSTVQRRTGRLDIDGTGTISFDGSVLGDPGTRPEVGIDITGDGAFRFVPTASADRADSRVRVDFVGVSGPEVARPGLSVSETVIVDGRRFESDDGITYRENDETRPPGALGSLVFVPDVLGRLDELADGDVTDLGVVEIDGVELRRLRFTASDALFSSIGAPPAEITILVSSVDGAIRRFRLVVDGPLADASIPSAEIRLDVTFDVVDVGSDVDIEMPN